MKRGATASAILHGLLLLVLAIGMPSWLESDALTIPPAMVVEILPVTSKTNVRPNPPQPKQQQQQPPKEQPKPEPPKEQPKPKDSVPLPEKPKDEPKKEEPKKEPKPDPAPEKKQEEPKKEKTEDSFDDLLKDLAKSAPQEPVNDAPKAKNTDYEEGEPLSISELDYIRQQMRKCWRVPAGMMDAHKILVKLRIDMQQDGSVRQVEVLDKMRFATDTGYRTMAESAIRAVRLCSPFSQLPPSKYGSWKTMDMTFDPSDSLY
jgi:outer membrane biosynthesis protein TonB